MSDKPIPSFFKDWMEQHKRLVQSIPDNMMRIEHEELIELVKFITEHSSECRMTSVSFRQSAKSGIGTNTYVKCSCGVEKDITDYTLW